MNFIQLCQRVYAEGGLSGDITSTVNQTGESHRVVGWVSSAYQEVLNDQGLSWTFLRKEATVQLTQGVGEYSFSDLNLAEGVQWDTRTMRVAVNPNLSDETFLQHMGFQQFRDYWLFSSRRTVTSRPLNAAVDLSTHLRIAPLPAGDYWLSFQYLINPEKLINNEDTLVIPDRFQMIVVWRAVRHYGMFEAAPEVVARADMALKEITLQLEMDQGFEVVVGGPLC